MNVIVKLNGGSISGLYRARKQKKKKESNMLVNLQICHQQLITRVQFKVKYTLPNPLFFPFSLTTIIKPRTKKDRWSPS